MTAAQAAFIPSQAYTDTALLRARTRLADLAEVKLHSTLDEVRLVQKGISVSTYDKSLKLLGTSSADPGWIIKPRTLSHRKAKNELLTREESGRWLRAVKLGALAEEVFGNQQKASLWLHKPRKPFGGQSAAELMQTEAGARLVEDTLNQIDSGYSA